MVNYDVIIAVDNPDLKLKPGMTATVQVITGERTGVLLIPNSAFRFKPPVAAAPGAGSTTPAGPPAASGPKPNAMMSGAKAETGEREVYLRPANPTDKLVPVKVKTGLNDGVQTEVLSGLKDGDEVITLIKPKQEESAGGVNPFGGGMGRR